MQILAKSPKAMTVKPARANSSKGLSLRSKVKTPAHASTHRQMIAATHPMSLLCTKPSQWVAGLKLGSGGHESPCLPDCSWLSSWNGGRPC